jgi:hypothetical protein
MLLDTLLPNTVKRKRTGVVPVPALIVPRPEPTKLETGRERPVFWSLALKPELSRTEVVESAAFATPTTRPLTELTVP